MPQIKWSGIKPWLGVYSEPLHATESEDKHRPDGPLYLYADLRNVHCNHTLRATFFQGCKVKVEVLKTEKKGWGLRTLEDLEQ